MLLWFMVLRREGGCVGTGEWASPWKPEALALYGSQRLFEHACMPPGQTLKEAATAGVLCAGGVAGGVVLIL